MTPNDELRFKWEQRRKALFAQALSLPPTQRISFLEKKTAGDVELLRSVCRLLETDGSSGVGILDRPVFAHQRDSGDAQPAAFGRYVVLHRIGRGGMGCVYACHDPASGKTVAVKVIHPGITSPATVRAFAAEQKILASMRHPNVCGILESGSAQNGQPYLVMEYVDGQRIDTYCKTRPPQERLRLFSQVLAGVAYFHNQDIVHRDLKPSNILVNAGGSAKILDFGIAKIADHTPGLTGLSPTQTPHPAMTPRYASPEQFSRLLSGRSSDVYSLGVILYELMTGSHPYEAECGQGPIQLFRAMSTRRPEAPSAIIPRSSPAVRAGMRNLTPSFWAAVDRMTEIALRHSPQDRYRSVADFLNDLRSCLRHYPAPGSIAKQG